MCLGVKSAEIQQQIQLREMMRLLQHSAQMYCMTFNILAFNEKSCFQCWFTTQTVIYQSHLAASLVRGWPACHSLLCAEPLVSGRTRIKSWRHKMTIKVGLENWHFVFPIQLPLTFTEALKQNVCASYS